MSGLLVDADFLERYNINREFIKTKHKKGVIYLFKEDSVKILKEKNLGKERIDFFLSIYKTNIFSKNIIYNEKNNSCILEITNETDLNFLKDLLNVLFIYLEKNCLIFLKTKNINTYNQILELGFSEPFIKNSYLYFTKLNDGYNKILLNYNHHLIENLHSIEKEKNCYSYYKFSNETLDFLRNCVKSGYHLEKDSLTFKKNKKQSEITGELFIEKIKKEKGKIINILSINKKTLSSGKEENVRVNNTRYNFHSHPEDAYNNHSVVKAWPSGTDYLGVLQLGNNTIFHVVTTLEGLYIMSFSNFWCNKIKKIDKEFVKKNYDINHKEKYTPREYVKHINSILYKGYPIFRIAFINWNDSKTKCIKINFSRLGSSCILTERNKENLKKLVTN
jgi:hypothetical protein